MTFFISPAFAQDATTAAGDAAASPQSFLVSLIPLLIILFIFYVMVLRPQNKRFSEHKAMIAGLRRGDKIVTGGGIIGTVRKVVSDDEILVDIAENVSVKIVSGTIMTLRTKVEATPPANDAAA